MISYSEVRARSNTRTLLAMIGFLHELSQRRDLPASVRTRAASLFEGYPSTGEILLLSTRDALQNKGRNVLIDIQSEQLQHSWHELLLSAWRAEALGATITTTKEGVRNADNSAC